MRAPKPPEYKSWRNMQRRCHSPTSTQYSYYGGRGIRVCDEWRGAGGFERFLAHIGPKPVGDYSLDRIDNERGYEPGNVRWATRVEQARNMRHRPTLIVDGVTKSQVELAEERGLPTRLVSRRRLDGWTLEQALAAPRDVRRKVTKDGLLKLREWRSEGVGSQEIARRLGVSRSLVVQILAGKIKWARGAA